MSTLPVINVNVAPKATVETAADPSCDGDLLTRGLLYAFFGGLLAAAFCTPLNPFRSVFMESYLYHAAVEAVVLSTLLTGLLLDRLVRSNGNTLLVGLAWTATNALAFTVIYLVGSFMGSGAVDLSAIKVLLVLLLPAAFYGFLLTLPLALPISVLGVWTARKLTSP